MTKTFNTSVDPFDVHRRARRLAQAGRLQELLSLVDELQSTNEWFAAIDTGRGYQLPNPDANPELRYTKSEAFELLGTYGYDPLHIFLISVELERA